MTLNNDPRAVTRIKQLTGGTEIKNATFWLGDLSQNRWILICPTNGESKAKNVGMKTQVTNTDKGVSLVSQ